MEGSGGGGDGRYEVGQLLLREGLFRPEEVVGQTLRIGTFVRAAAQISAGWRMCLVVVENARSIPNVEYVQEDLFCCSDDAQKRMAEKIRDLDLNRVVMAACTPLTHQVIFQDMLRTAGLNIYLFEMANIRNQCTWVHQGNPEKATRKCEDLIRMAAAKARLIEPRHARKRRHQP